MAAKYRIGEPLPLLYKGQPCRARIVDAWRPGGKKNTTMYRVEMWPIDGSIVIEFFETAHLTARLEADRKAVQS